VAGGQSLAAGDVALCAGFIAGSESRKEANRRRASAAQHRAGKRKPRMPLCLALRGFPAIRVLGGIMIGNGIICRCSDGVERGQHRQPSAATSGVKRYFLGFDGFDGFGD